VRAASGGQTLLFIQLIDFLAIRRRPPRDAYLARHLAITARTARRAGLAARGAADEAAVRAALARCPRRAAAILDAARARGSRRSATASASPTPTCRTSPRCRRCCPGCSPPPPARAAAAGFDGVELHFAHAYTMASFLSALNTRTDGYGGIAPGGCGCRAR
jgi:hypothetical protein